MARLTRGARGVLTSFAFSIAQLALEILEEGSSRTARIALTVVQDHVVCDLVATGTCGRLVVNTRLARIIAVESDAHTTLDCVNLRNSICEISRKIPAC